MTAYKERFSKEPEWLAANSYDAISMVAAVLRQSSYTSQAIRLGLAGIKDFTGVSGTTSFDAQGGVKKPISLVVVKSGTFKRLAEN